MFDVWGAEDVFAADEGCFPDLVQGPFASQRGGEGGSSPSVPSDSDSFAGELWGLAATALAGVAAYAGVRRLLDRHRGDPGGPAVPTAARRTPAGTSPPTDTSDQRAADLASAVTANLADGATGAGSPQSDGERTALQLVDDLIALYDLESSDTLRRRIVRSLAKARVRMDDEISIAFDSERHDVMGTVPAEPGVAPGTVIEVVRAGFVRDGGQVVRATEVVVATDADGAW